MKILASTLKILGEARERSPACLIFYSGGKDSLAMADLCVRAFERVEGVFMYFVPGLECVDRQLEYGRQRWGLKIHQFPHWCLTRILQAGVYRFVGKDGLTSQNYVYTGDLDDEALIGTLGEKAKKNRKKFRMNGEGIPELSLNDVYAMAKTETGISLIATGAKKADSLWRRKMLGNWGTRPDIIYPLKDWNKPDVYAYLMAQKIPIPGGTSGSSTGIDLTQKSLLWMHDTYPDDFWKICEVFPFAEAVVWHRKFYGDVSTTG